PPNQKMDGSYHTIKVKLVGKQKYALQARRGYYAPKKLNDPQEIEKQEIQDAVFSQDEIDDLPLVCRRSILRRTIPRPGSAWFPACSLGACTSAKRMAAIWTI